MWMVLLTITVCCIFNASALITKFIKLIFILWPAAVWKDLRTRWYHFQGVFSYLTRLRWAKGSFGPVAPPVTTPNVTVSGPEQVSTPSFTSLSTIRTTIPAVILTYILCAYVYVLCDLSVID